MSADPPAYSELSEHERALYPRELAHAYRLIQSVAARLDQGDEYDKHDAFGLRGVARAVDGHAAGIARGKAFRLSQAGGLGRFFKRFANRS